LSRDAFRRTPAKPERDDSRLVRDGATATPGESIPWTLWQGMRGGSPAPAETKNRLSM